MASKIFAAELQSNCPCRELWAKDAEFNFTDVCGMCGKTLQDSSGFSNPACLDIHIR
jgi:hypothetical protein